MNPISSCTPSLHRPEHRVQGPCLPLHHESCTHINQSPAEKDTVYNFFKVTNRAITIDTLWLGQVAKLYYYLFCDEDLNFLDDMDLHLGAQDYINWRNGQDILNILLCPVCVWEGVGVNKIVPNCTCT